jgi:hypothetical protein
MSNFEIINIYPNTPMTKANREEKNLKYRKNFHPEGRAVLTNVPGVNRNALLTKRRKNALKKAHTTERPQLNAVPKAPGTPSYANGSMLSRAYQSLFNTSKYGFGFNTMRAKYGDAKILGNKAAKATALKSSRNTRLNSPSNRLNATVSEPPRNPKRNGVRLKSPGNSPESFDEKIHIPGMNVNTKATVSDPPQNTIRNSLSLRVKGPGNSNINFKERINFPRTNANNNNNNNQSGITNRDSLNSQNKKLTNIEKIKKFLIEAGYENNNDLRNKLVKLQAKIPELNNTNLSASIFKSILRRINSQKTGISNGVTLMKSIESIIVNRK